MYSKVYFMSYGVIKLHFYLSTDWTFTKKIVCKNI